jgi:hypothetical protein
MPITNLTKQDESGIIVGRIQMIKHEQYRKSISNVPLMLVVNVKLGYSKCMCVIKVRCNADGGRK